MERLNKFLYGLGTGVIIGTAAGLLLAPKTGEETRQIFADRSKTIRRRAVGTVRRAMGERRADAIEARTESHPEVAG